MEVAWTAFPNGKLVRRQVRPERLYSDQKTRVNAVIAFFLRLSIMELCSRV
ncbi:hypothetical protein AKJ09_09742 [Labilithrix luteola]|uniref:Mobile element protein n=1 Tax=Labilithrix luteola TaxID=1391654 RepID=A0A0K1QBF3_9BACT|nr:hypothetical protein AKJ09_09742 [Labilithrix luteola]